MKQFTQRKQPFYDHYTG